MVKLLGVSCVAYSPNLFGLFVAENSLSAADCLYQKHLATQTTTKIILRLADRFMFSGHCFVLFLLMNWSDRGKLSWCISG